MISVIQGDSIDELVIVESGADLIEELWFSCKHLGISKPLPKENETTYILSFSPQMTKDWPVSNTTYDITVILKGDQRRTPVYNDRLRVLKKENTIDGNQD